MTSRFMGLMLFLISTAFANAASFSDYDAFYQSLPDQTYFRQLEGEFEPVFWEGKANGNWRIGKTCHKISYWGKNGGLVHTYPNMKQTPRFYYWSKATHLDTDISSEPNLLDAQGYVAGRKDFCIRAGFSGLGQSGTFQRVKGVFAVIHGHPYFLVGLEASCKAFRQQPDGGIYFIKLRYSKTEEETLVQEKISIGQKSLQVQGLMPERLKLDGNFYRFHTEGNLQNSPVN